MQAFLEYKQLKNSIKEINAARHFIEKNSNKPDYIKKYAALMKKELDKIEALFKSPVL